MVLLVDKEPGYFQRSFPDVVQDGMRSQPGVIAGIALYPKGRINDISACGAKGVFRTSRRITDFPLSLAVCTSELRQICIAQPVGKTLYKIFC
jgi:hypothetical protein